MSKRSRSRRKSDPDKTGVSELVSPNKDGSDVSLAPTRRKFIQGSGLILAGSAIAGAGLSPARAAHAIGSDTIKIGLVGCGWRGTAAAISTMNTASSDTSANGVKLVAMADMFEHAVQTAYRTIKGRVAARDPADCDHVARFSGLDGFRGVIDSDADLVILATPPVFRPDHFSLAVESGKQVFMERPVAVDAAGVNQILEAGKVAQSKGLSVAVGLQRRHDLRTMECVDAIHGGILGDLQYAKAYWKGSTSPVQPQRDKESQLEYELRNWRHFRSHSGDLINEHQVQTLDLFNHIFGDHPAIACGQGGLSPAVNGEEQGSGSGPDVFDHHAVEFTYPSGVSLFLQCQRQSLSQRHSKSLRVIEAVHGSKGVCDLVTGTIRDLSGKKIWQSSSNSSKGNGQQMQLDHFVKSLREGVQVNELDYAAKSTLTAILGTVASYRGDSVKWDDLGQS
ncbi:Gfo/Idh/MocA family protein [Rubripirellula amarantea]|nr:Gfo/Idh/MocA family oxidoreductase [Rubripirellula amarantea]